MGVITRGVTYALGGTVTHENIVQLFTNGSVAGVNRGNLDSSEYSFISSSTPAPYSKEARIDASSDVISTYNQSLGTFKPALRTEIRCIWKGSSAVSQGEAVRSVGGKTDGVLHVDRARSTAAGFLGVASSDASVDSDFIVQTHGCAFVKVAGSAVRGQGLKIGSTTFGALDPVGSGDFGMIVVATALESGTGKVWAWIRG